MDQNSKNTLDHKYQTKNPNKKNLFVHIGYGKAGSTSLQKKIFSALTNFLNYKYFGSDYFNSERKKYGNLITNLTTNMDLGFPVKKINMPNNFLLSSEELSSYRNPEYFEEFAEKTLMAFGKEAHIIFVIREPKSFLNSIYSQLCLIEKPFQEPQDFFLTKENYSERLPNAKFNVDKFNYINHINFLRDRFNNVTVVKFEALNEMQFIKRIFPIDNNQLSQLKKTYKSSVVNRGVSVFAYHVIKTFFKFYRILGLTFMPKYNNELLLLRKEDKFISEGYNLIAKKRNTNKIFIMKIIFQCFRYIMRLFHYKFLFVKIIDKIAPYKKFTLNFEKLPYIEIDKLEEIYKNLPDDITYSK